MDYTVTEMNFVVEGACFDKKLAARRLKAYSDNF